MISSSNKKPCNHKETSGTGLLTWTIHLQLKSGPRGCFEDPPGKTIWRWNRINYLPADN